MKLLSLLLIPASLTGVALGIMHYPLNPFWLGLALACYAGLLRVKPRFWLFVIPAILPIADLAPWSGWLFFEELDLFVLATLMVGYYKLARNEPDSRLPAAAALLLFLLALSFAISAWRGLIPLQGFDANAFGNYFSHYNSLRILKPFVWALLLLPLLKRSVDGGNIERLFIPGILTGLALVALAALWERLAFTGLMDFSSDYRITSTFPEMHTGGAALDAYLALTLPFALFWILRGKGMLSSIAVIPVLVSGIYAALATFSRGLYMAIAASLAVILGIVTIGSQRRRGSVVSMTVIFAVVVALLVNVFASGGYRGLFVAVLSLWAAFFVGGSGPLPFKGAIAALMVLFVPISFILFEMSAKGAYLSFGLACSIFLVGFLIHAIFRNEMGKIGIMLAAAGFFAMAASGLMVDWHWGGQPALVSGVAMSALIFALVLVNAWIAVPLWRWDRSNAQLLSLALMLVSLAIPVIGNYYVGERFSQVNTDWQDRTDHWFEVLSMMDADWETHAFGMGLGKFPETYFWKTKKGRPGTYRIETEEGGAYLRLTGSMPGWSGDYLRYGQRVDIQPYRPYVLELEARSTFSKELLVSGMCEKLLLYGDHCIQNTLSMEPDGKWHRYTVQFNSGDIGSAPWYKRPTVQFYLANASEGGFMDLKNVVLADEGGSILHNGDFSHGADRWFFSSDHYHLPWHEKNLMLHVYFEQGVLGLGAFFMLLLLAVVRLMYGTGRNRLLSAVFLSSFSGFLIVGLFDSILDFPRLALLVYLMLFLCLLQPKTAG
ncbi:MAG: hypothetical protein K2P57_00550 [Burkholderiales bacterium]|nr:hypothetical protein [Burkholderiales bacterium]